MTKAAPATRRRRQPQPAPEPGVPLALAHARLVLHPLLIEPAADAQALPRLVNEAPARVFDAPVDLVYVAALQAMAYAVTCFLHADPGLAATQARLLNESLARIEFCVEEGEAGRPVLRSRLREQGG